MVTPEASLSEEYYYHERFNIPVIDSIDHQLEYSNLSIVRLNYIQQSLLSLILRNLLKLICFCFVCFVCLGFIVPLEKFYSYANNIITGEGLCTALTASEQ